MKALAAWCCLMQTAFAVNRPEMIHRARPAVDHSSSLLMAPTISRSDTSFERAEKVPSILDRLKSATSFKSLRAKAASLCPHSDNSTEVCSGKSMRFNMCNQGTILRNYSQSHLIERISHCYTTPFVPRLADRLHIEFCRVALNFRSTYPRILS